MARGGISVVIPVFNDAVPLRRLIDDLRDTELEIVVVDGGSDDDSVSVAKDAGRVVSAPRGRGMQMAAGVPAANGEWLWFMHADTRLSQQVVAALLDRLDKPRWGFFSVRLDGGSWPYRMIERTMSWRAAASGIATGDQGIFVHRELLDAVGGVPRQPLLEDVELCRRLRRLAKPMVLREPLLTSSRRWERNGIARTILVMWWLRFRYFAGADPNSLAREYYG
ncbi:MAG: TIGR04283 family arsenosugar biosynthesis glycosyltransferase [Gammaproteobacteria bacterium]|nr:TIGR04283 family arsenosugar biosynthesis glycosyltransferase [Gammaproteobacteria bacterium]MDE0444261.1 TIGR04283 family arsenosugar biosynthesis glycosyltransferase [Gammaproteobacteria bacterium]